MEQCVALRAESWHKPQGRGLPRKDTGHTVHLWEGDPTKSLLSATTLITTQPNHTSRDTSSGFSVTAQGIDLRST